MAAGESGFRLWVRGKPQPGGRPRFRIQNGRPHTYPDPADQPAKAKIAIAWMTAGRPFLTGPYAALCWVEVPHSPSHWKKNGQLTARARKMLLPDGDVDNYAKLALDALVDCRAIPDDTLCKTLLIEKDWAPGQHDPGRLIIEIQPRSPERSDSMPSIAWSQIDAGDTSAAAA